MRYLSAVPAYGRDYKSKKEVLADWEAGKDFHIEDLVASGYVNKDDKPAGVTLNIRYANQRRVCVIE
jgi:hypothetical protein